MKDKIRQIIKEEIEKVFMFEERGVADNVKIATTAVVNKIKEHEQKITSGDWTLKEYSTIKNLIVLKYSEHLDLTFSDLFFKNLSVHLQLFKPYKTKIPLQILKNTNRGKLSERVDFDIDGKIKKAQVELSICYNGQIDNSVTYGLISHELSHLYEFYKKGRYYISPRHDLYNNLFNNEDNKKIKNLTFLFYCMCYFELNANVVSVYHELYYNKFAVDYKTALNAYYKTNTYNQFLKYLEHPELIINNKFLKNFDEYDLDLLNNNIDDALSQVPGINTDKLKKEIYFDEGKESAEGYLKRIMAMCKEAHQLNMEKVGKVISKVVDDKNNSLIKKEHLGYFHEDGGLGIYLD